MTETPHALELAPTRVSRDMIAREEGTISLPERDPPLSLPASKNNAAPGHDTGGGPGRAEVGIRKHALASKRREASFRTLRLG